MLCQQYKTICKNKQSLLVASFEFLFFGRKFLSFMWNDLALQIEIQFCQFFFHHVWLYKLIQEDQFVVLFQINTLPSRLFTTLPRNLIQHSESKGHIWTFTVIYYVMMHFKIKLTSAVGFFSFQVIICRSDIFPVNNFDKFSIFFFDSLHNLFKLSLCSDIFFELLSLLFFFNRL